MRRLTALVVVGLALWLVPIWLLNGGPLSTPTVSDVAAVCEGSTMQDCPGGVGRVAAEAPGALIAVCNYSDGSGGIYIVEKPEDAAAYCDASAAGVETDILRVVRLSPTASLPPPSIWPPPLPTPTELHSPEVGVEYEYVTLTHCAFTGIVVDGEWWLPVGGPVGREGTDKFDFNWDRGTVVLTDSTHATYTSSLGYVVQVEPWEGPLPSVGICM